MMPIISLFKRFQQDQASVASTIPSVKEFNAILSKERARSDRNGHGFSVASFALRAEAGALQLEFLLDILGKQIRATDDIGWFAENVVGVLLYNTPIDGAWEFVNNVRGSIDQLRIPHSCDVFTYPKDWSKINDEHPHVEISQSNHSAAEMLKNAETLYRIFSKKQPVWKRTLDIFVSSLALVVFSPLMLAAAIAVKMTSPGPVFFKQPRAGLGGKPFFCLKFRSMCVDAEKMKEQLWQHNERTGPVFKMTDDPRVTRIGKFMRQWSIDELPQLINVWLGDMSLVGPRPPSMDEVEKYLRWHNYRLDIKPGITCIWQVYARHNKSFEDWVRLDIEYVRNQSALLDLKLLLLTIPAVLSRKGAC